MPSDVSATVLGTEGICHLYSVRHVWISPAASDFGNFAIKLVLNINMDLVADEEESSIVANLESWHTDPYLYTQDGIITFRTWLALRHGVEPMLGCSLTATL